MVEMGGVEPPCRRGPFMVLRDVEIFLCLSTQAMKVTKYLDTDFLSAIRGSSVRRNAAHLSQADDASSLLSGSDGEKRCLDVNYA